MARGRQVGVVQGTGIFAGPQSLDVTLTNNERQSINFDRAIIAAGSEAIRLPFMPYDPRIVDPTSALEIASVPKRLLVIGGGTASDLNLRCEQSQLFRCMTESFSALCQ